jgi:hypothetical protein
MRFFEDSNPLKHANNTEPLLFVSTDRLRSTYALHTLPQVYTFLLGLFNIAVPPTETRSRPFIYL